MRLKNGRYEKILAIGLAARSAKYYKIIRIHCGMYHIHISLY